MNTPSPLAPSALAKLKGLTLRCQRVVDGLAQGLHRSPHFGSSAEFSGHKEYSPGDDVRHIDWHALARSDRVVVKRFEHETNLSAWTLVDASGSMAYGAKHVGLSKFEVASVLALSLSYILLKQQDAAGMLTYGEDVKESLLPASNLSHIQHLGAMLEGTKPAGGTDLTSPVQWVGEHARKRGLIAVFSDFLSDPAKDFSALRRLSAQGHHMAAFHLIDPDELTFPFEKMALFEGMESRHRLLAEPRLIRSAYMERFAAHRDRIKEECQRGRIHYVPVNTGTPPHQVLTAFLSHWNRR